MIVWMLVPFWSAPIETVLTDLAARPDGLTQIEADRQRLRFGPNRRSDTRKTTPLGLLLNQFRSPLVLLLLFAMALSLFLGETTDGLIVLAIGTRQRSARLPAGVPERAARSPSSWR